VREENTRGGERSGADGTFVKCILRAFRFLPFSTRNTLLQPRRRMLLAITSWVVDEIKLDIRRDLGRWPQVL